MLCTIQDEAFVLLLMMNNWKVWELMAKGDKRGRGSSPEINSLSLFTNKKAKFGDKEQVVKGWNRDGINEFNKNVQHLIMVRNMHDTKEIESRLMSEYKDLLKRGSKQSRENYDDEIISYIVFVLIHFYIRSSLRGE